ncbi:MAG: fibro-slime domain-containing protein, partial [Phycisphaeraceae bacterium]
VRDFQQSHSDMEDTYNAKYPVITNMVEAKLGQDGKPILNIRPGGAIEIDVESLDKDLSNVVLELRHIHYLEMEDDGIAHFKYDGLTGKTGTFPLPEGYEDYRIVGAWIKAGNNASGDGPGYGELVDGEIDGEYIDYADSEPVESNSGDFIVTFIAITPVPREWRVKSEDSFNQWFNNVDGVNQSMPFTIELKSTSGETGGIYRYERSKNNQRPFFPIDAALFGNEGLEHNYHFTFEISTTFYYDDPAERDWPMTLEFSGDDDVWVFINGHLVIDLGGVHGEAWSSVDLDARAAELGLSTEEPNTFHFFFAERHTTQSNLTLETNMRFVQPLYD